MIGCFLNNDSDWLFFRGNYPTKNYKNPSELLNHHMKMLFINTDIALFAIGITLIILGTYQERKAQKAIEELRFWTEVLRGFNERKDDGEKTIK